MTWARISRVLGATWFFCLALAVFHAFSIAKDVSVVLTTSCLALFYFILGYLILIRPAAQAAAVGVMPRVTAFLGGYGIWTLALLPRTDYAWANELSPVLVLLGMSGVMWAISNLWGSFSITPQARKVVLSGPYRFVAHPLYSFEEVVIVGVLLQHLSVLAIAIVLAHLALQIWRMDFEERLLREIYIDAINLPRWRLLPFVF